MDYPRPLGSMFFHFFEFLGSKLPRLSKYLIFDRNLPQIMHRSSLDHIPAELVRQRQLLILAHMFNKHFHQIARTSYMSAG